MEGLLDQKSWMKSYSHSVCLCSMQQDGGSFQSGSVHHWEKMVSPHILVEIYSTIGTLPPLKSEVPSPLQRCQLSIYVQTLCKLPPPHKHLSIKICKTCCIKTQSHWNFKLRCRRRAEGSLKRQTEHMSTDYCLNRSNAPCTELCQDFVFPWSLCKPLPSP